MKRFICILSFLSLLLSCQKPVLVCTETDLGRKVVDENQGTFPVMVTTDGAWYAVSDSPWIKVDGSLHSGNSVFTVTYANNLSYEGHCALCRIGSIRVVTCDGATSARLQLWQKGKSPMFTFPELTTLKSEGGTCSVACVTDLPSEGIPGVAFRNDATWISNLRWGDDCRSVTLDAQAGSGRSAIITLIHTDTWGQQTEVEFKVVQ